MTEDSVVRKLRAALSDRVDSECKVVYILAQSRKLLETYPPDPSPFSLKLYCHWALHVDLDSPWTTLPFLTRVDKYIAGVLDGKEDIVESHQILRDFALLDTFRDQFRVFLRAYELPTAVCDADSLWHEFVRHYAGVIEDGSLGCRVRASCKTRKEEHPLKLVSEVIFGKGRTPPESDKFYIPFQLAWTIVLVDGRRVILEAGASAPRGIEGISFVIRLQ